MNPSMIRKYLIRPAAGIIGAAVLLVPAVAYASTAANTQISNTATVNYQDAGGVAQGPITASVTVTVTLVPAAATLSSPPNQTIAQATSATLTYTITGNANGPDTYNLSSVATPTNATGVSVTLPANATLGGTTLAANAVAGNTTITVPYDGVGGATVNGIGAGSVIVIGGNAYTVAAGGVSKNAPANTATITLTAAISGATANAGAIVGDQETCTATVPPGKV